MYKYRHIFIGEFYIVLGPLLRTIQMSALYKDSKTFVDKKLKYPAGKIIKNFETLDNQQDGELLSIEQIKQVRLVDSFNCKYKSSIKLELIVLRSIR